MHRLHRSWTTAFALGLLAVTASGCLGGSPQADAPQASPAARSHRTSSPAPSPTPSSPATSSPPAASASASLSSDPAPSQSLAPSTGTPGDAGSNDPAVAPSSPAISPSGGGAAPRLVRYSGDGVTVQSAADADRLRGTSPEFRRFVVDHVPQGDADCGRGSLTVKAWRADGFAVGDVFECPGGYRAIWGTAGGSWRQLIGSQDVWSCSDLRRWSVPTSIAGDKCYAAGGLQDYHQA